MGVAARQVMTSTHSNFLKPIIAITFRALCIGVLLLMLDSGASVQAQASQAQLRVLQSDTSRIVLELEVAGYDARTITANGVTYLALSVPGLGRIGETGKPALPIKGAMVAIPPGAQATLKILADEVRRDALVYPPVPVLTQRVEYNPMQPLPRDAGRSFVRDTAAYSANQLYPAQTARIAADGNWRSQRYLVVEFHPFQYDPAARQLIFHRRLRVEVAFAYPRGQTREALGVPLDEGAFEPILQNALVNYASAKNWRAPISNQVPISNRQRPASNAWYKIAVDADGMYRITCAQLQSLGIDPATLDPNTLKVYKQDIELATYLVWQSDGSCNDDAHYLLFWGQGVNTKYTNMNIYWLTFGGANGKRMPTRDGGGTGSTPTTFTNTMYREQNLLYRSYIPWAASAEHWFWNYLPDSLDDDGNGDPNTADYAFTIDQLAAGTYSANLTVTLVGFTSGAHRTQVYVAGNLIDDATWSGQVERNATISFPQAFLNEGTNTIRVSETHPGSLVFVNNFDVSYTHAFNTANNALRFRQAVNGAWRYQITGFTAATIEAFDITDPQNIMRFTPTTIVPANPTQTLQFADAITTPHEYIALTQAQFKTPSITLDTSSNLKNTTNGADYIVIAYGEFIPNIQPLANLRAAQGLRVKVVDVQDVYDEFSDGLVDAQAIRDFLAYAYANWQAPAPAFVLLVGDGTFDPKGNCVTPGTCLNVITPPNSTLIPPYLRFVDPWLGETASDNRFVAFNDATDNSLPSLAIGRLPVNTAAEVDAMVNKILSNEQNPPLGNWRRTFAFVADDPDSAGDFWALSDVLVNNSQFVPSAFTAERIYYGQPAYPTFEAARNGIVSAMNAGRLIVNYIGHGGIQQWAHEQILGLDEVNALTNSGKYPVMLEMTCYTGYFQFPGLPGLAETNVRAGGKGVLASWSASGLGIATGHDYLIRGFLDAVMQQGVRRIGVAAVLGKQNLYANGGGANLDLLDTYNLLGDPASRLAIQLPIYLPLVVR